MTRVACVSLFAAILAALLGPSAVVAAPKAEKTEAALPPPELTEQSIDQADLIGWRARLDARALAQAARDALAPAKTTKREKKGKRQKPKEASAQTGKGVEPPDPFLVRMQILLDRAHASPGVIDGRDGGNTTKAVRAFQRMRGLEETGEPNDAFWAALSADGGKATRVYEISKADVDGRYVPNLPKDYAKLARLKWLGYGGPLEMLAERFHMDEALLSALNPGADFKRIGQKILVAEVAGEPTAKVMRIVIDKDGGELRAFDREGKLVLVDPATVGSQDTPSPSGRMKVNGAFPNPHYRYDPQKNFLQGNNRRKLNLPPGPNGPVGAMWIDLTKPTYGIHGTPDPEKIDKTGSHGCVRLTNWDAAALGKLVVKGKTEVVFE